MGEKSYPVIRDISNFIEALRPDEKPFTEMLPKGAAWGKTPDFCLREKKVSVEPFITFYEETLAVIDDVTPAGMKNDDPDYDDYWIDYTPSPGLVRLRKLAYQIGQHSYKEVPNPAYNEAECLAWKEANAKTFTKIEWGMSNLHPYEEAVIVTPEGPRVVDEGEEV